MKTNQIAWLLFGTLFLAGVAWGFRPNVNTGVDMTTAAEKYLASLNDEQRKVSNLEYEVAERVDWHFIPKPTRKGLQIKEMNQEQRGAALTLVRSALSEIGYDKATKIMALENFLRELEKGKTGTPLRDPERYYVTIFGKPEATGRWGLSFEGHHLSLNFVVEKGKVISSTPTVFASNPALVRNEVAGAAKPGTRILAAEELLAFELLASLSADQKKVAIVSAEPLKEVRAAGEAQPPQTPPEGISAEKLSSKQQQILNSLLAAYANNLPDEVARERLEEIAKSGIEKVHFAWAGATKPGIGHYYKIQGPTFLIEFVNTQPDAAGNPANHIHCLWRDPRGDFAIPVASN